MVRHIVSWNFKPELTEQQRKELAVQVVEQLNACLLYTSRCV